MSQLVQSGGTFSHACTHCALLCWNPHVAANSSYRKDFEGTQAIWPQINARKITISLVFYCHLPRLSISSNANANCYYVLLL